MIVENLEFREDLSALTISYTVEIVHIVSASYQLGERRRKREIERGRERQRYELDLFFLWLRKSTRSLIV